MKTMDIKKPATKAGFNFNFADWTRLELATSAVTGRHSNQLNYQSVNYFLFCYLFLKELFCFSDCKDRGLLFPTKYFIKITEDLFL